MPRGGRWEAAVRAEGRRPQGIGGGCGFPQTVLMGPEPHRHLQAGVQEPGVCGGLARGHGAPPVHPGPWSVGLGPGALEGRQGDEELGSVVGDHDHKAGMWQRLDEGVPRQHHI